MGNTRPNESRPLRHYERVALIVGAELDVYEKGVLHVLNFHLGTNDWTWVSQAVLAKEGGFSDSKTRLTLKALKLAGIVDARPANEIKPSLRGNAHRINWGRLASLQSPPPEGARRAPIEDDEGAPGAPQERTSCASRAHTVRFEGAHGAPRTNKGTGSRTKPVNRALVFSKTASADPSVEEGSPRITDLLPEDLTDTGRLLELHRQAVNRGWAASSYLGPAGELSFVSAAVHAQRVVRQHGRGDPVRLFAWYARGLDRPINDARGFGTKRRSDLITGEDEQLAHQRIQKHRYGQTPRGAPPLSADARIVQYFLRVARNHGWYGKPERLFAMLRQRLGDSWTPHRWEDACAELREGAGPVHVGKILSACLASLGVVEPTVKLFPCKESVQGVA